MISIGSFFAERAKASTTRDKQFRQPAFLATSFDQKVAQTFIARSKMPSRVLWKVRIDREKKCLHVNLVQKSNVENEQEYLFAPYSAFTVEKATKRAGTANDPHVIELLAVHDNKAAPVNLRLAPWS